MNKLLFISLILVFKLFTNCFAGTEESLAKTEYNLKNYAIYTNKAKKYLNSEDYGKAADNYKKAIDVLKEAIEDYHQFAVFYFKKGKREKSIEFYQKIHKINLKLAKNYLDLGIIYNQNQNYDKALELYQKSHFLFPTNKDEVCRLLKDMYKKINPKKQANIFYKKTCKDNFQHWGKGLYLRSNYNNSYDFSRALDYYSNLYKEGFNSTYLSKAFYELGNKCMKEGNYAKSVKYFKKAIDYKPTYIRPYIALADYFQQRGQYDKSIRYLKKSLEINPSHFGACKRLGDIYNILGKYKKAIKYFEEAREISPNNISVSFNLGKSYIRIGQKDKAFREIEKLRQLGRDDLADGLIAESMKWD